MSEIHVMLRNADVASAPLIKLLDGRTVVGRDPTCGIVVADPAISRFHAELSIEGTSISVRDLGSRNGTFVDSERVDSAPISAGQILCVGPVHFVVEITSRNLRGEEAAVETKSVEDVLPGDAVQPDEPSLSPAERRVFDLMLPGLAEKQIARRLQISPHTVHTHVRKIYEVFGVRSRAELAALFIRQPDRNAAGAGKTIVPSPER